MYIDILQKAIYMFHNGHIYLQFTPYQTFLLLLSLQPEI